MKCINTPILERAKKQINEYFNFKRQSFDLRLYPNGTSFQHKVWNALLEIPYGETMSYEDIAIKINNPKACRAVGLANHNNPIAIVIPCHRVIGKNKKLVRIRRWVRYKEVSIRFRKQIE